ncbi:MAG: hypothetical protein AAGF23_03295, partial [Acidobacteriota bacterium]
DGWDTDWALQMESAEAESGSVERAMSKLRRRLEAREDPFGALDAEGLRGLAARLDLDTTLLAKLRHRRLTPESIPPALIDALAAELGAHRGALLAHFAAAPQVPMDVHFKAEEGPTPAAQETFLDALRRSAPDDVPARRRWLE